MLLMRIMGTADGGLIIDEASSIYLQLYDMNEGTITLTTHKHKAMKFAGLHEVLRVWKTVPLKYPIRHDMQPNRPLSAFNISPVDYDAVPG